MNKLDVLAFAAHPDDAELSCSGTLAKMQAAGKKTGIIDLTRGELGTRGSAELRAEEAAAAAAILKLDVRENLAMRDGWFEKSEENRLAIIRVIRKYRPRVILLNAPEDRHPDHGRAAGLVKEAAFLSGLQRITTTHQGEKQEAWRPRNYFYYIQDKLLKPDFVIDISRFWEVKSASIQAYASQFYNPESDAPETYISSQRFMRMIEARARQMGHFIGAEYGEGFIADTPLKVDLLTDLL